MINLLPEDEKSEINAGRINAVLLRQVIFLIGLMLVLFAELGVSYLFLNMTKTSAENKLANSEQLTQEGKRVSEFRTNVATTKQILNKQVDYSSIILKIASQVPPGVVLNSLSLSPDSFGKPVTITARASNEAAVIKLKDTWNNSPYFSNTHFDNISNVGGTDAYPISITLTTTFTEKLRNENN